MTVEKSPRTGPPPDVAITPLTATADPAGQSAAQPDEPDGLPPDLPADGSVDPDDYRPFISASADMTFVRTLDGVFRYVSPASRTLFGWTPAELEGFPEADFVHPDDLPALEAGRAGLDTVRDHVTAVYRFSDRRGSYRWTETSSRLVRGDTSWLVVSTMRDITERRRRTAALELQALTDPLTGVANRNVLMDRLRQGLRRLTRWRGPGRPLSRPGPLQGHQRLVRPSRRGPDPPESGGTAHRAPPAGGHARPVGRRRVRDRGGGDGERGGRGRARRADGRGRPPPYPGRQRGLRVHPQHRRGVHR